jgi:hypothetical protein
VTVPFSSNWSCPRPYGINSGVVRLRHSSTLGINMTIIDPAVLKELATGFQKINDDLDTLTEPVDPTLPPGARAAQAAARKVAQQDVIAQYSRLGPQLLALDEALPANTQLSAASIQQAAPQLTQQQIAAGLAKVTGAGGPSAYLFAASGLVSADQQILTNTLTIPDQGITDLTMNHCDFAWVFLIMGAAVTIASGAAGNPAVGGLGATLIGVGAAGVIQYC